MIITVVEYECTECGEKDHDKLFEHESAVIAYNCPSCHAKNSMHPAGETTKYKTH